MSDIYTCKVCGGALYQPAILTYQNSPPSAQGFSTALDVDTGTVDINIFQCSCCGLIQHNLSPVSYYRDVIRAVAFSAEMAQFRVAQFSEWDHTFELSDKRLLEIGCGKGEYLELLLQVGFNQVYGLEHSSENVKSAIQKGFNVCQGYLSSCFESPWVEKFDAFAIFSFMEHWPDINGSLRSLHNLLNDGAFGLVEVPNFDFILDNGLYSEFTTDHIFYFTVETLRTVLEFNGFMVLSISPVWHDYILSAKIKKRDILDASAFICQQKNIISQIDGFIEKFEPKDVVIWGAGHQSLAVISMAQLMDKVSHVVDSAPFKQNKYTPGSRLLIKPPESLIPDSPKALIIMAAAYSDEVASIVLEKYPHIKYIAILRESQLEIIHGE